MIHVEFEPGEVYAGYDMTLADLILNGCVTKVLEGFSKEDEYRDIRHRVLAIRDEAIKELIQGTIKDAVSIALQPTDSFGNPKGDPVSLPELIKREAIEFLKKPADPYSREKGSWVQNLIRKEIGSAVEREMKAALDEGKAEIKAALKAKGAEMLEKALIEMAQGKIT